MMPREVAYLMSGPAHCPYLTVSVHTLRQHWSGRIKVYCFDESYPFVQQIAKDSRLAIDFELFSPEYRSKNAQFLGKIQMMQKASVCSRVYLDADTTIHGNIQPLFQAAEKHGFAATQFNKWTTSGRVVQGRIERLRPHNVPSDLIDQVCSPPHYPSVNGGIFAAVPDSPVLPQWYEWSWWARSIFICDEAAMHLLQLRFNEDQYTTILGGRYNCSHRYQHKHKDPVEDVIIYHYHGDGCVRPQKSPNGYANWWPIYERCLEQNIGNINDWKQHCGNRWIRKLEQVVPTS